MEISEVGGGRPVRQKQAIHQPKTEEAPASDSVEISEEAREALKISRLAKKVIALPDVRPEKVEEGKNMIESGEVLSEEVAKLTARKILRSDDV